MPRAEKPTNAADAPAPRRRSRLSVASTSSNQGVEQPNNTPKKRKRRSTSLPPSPAKETAEPQRKRANTLDTSAINKPIEKVKDSRKSRQSSGSSISSAEGFDSDQSYNSDASVAGSSVDNETDSGIGTSEEEEGIIFSVQEIVEYYCEAVDLEGLKAFEQQLIEDELEKKDSDTEISEDGKANSKGFWKTLLEKRVGFDAEAMLQIEEELAKDGFGQLPKMLPELMLRLAYEIRLATDIEYDPENENEDEKHKNPYASLDSKRAFFLFKKLHGVMSPEQRRKIVELAVEEDNLRFIKYVCKEHMIKGQLESSCSWQGDFSGFLTILELL